MTDHLYEKALEYHRQFPPGKLEVVPTKPLATKEDLALAYSPGVAAACLAIVDDPHMASEMTARGNLVAVISNGTAVLGLGDIGPLAGKPVMEGKAVLFKKFSGIDVFDIEIEEKDPDKLVDIIASLEPTFGAINLEDIKAPQCFIVEEKLKERMNIPVFHDDQHGTAIIVGAASLNALRYVGKKIEDVKLVASGAGAAALACLNVLYGLGLQRKNVIVTDQTGVIFKGRTEKMDPYKSQHATESKARTLDEAIEGADMFLGLSGAGVLKPDMVKKMGPKPIIFALANPDPEILPEDVRKVRKDAIVATGRSDYPNQVNNVLCFPFIFRGALDVGATTINEPMKIACVKALADLAMQEPSDVVSAAYPGEDLKFGPNYIIPKPFDPRLILAVAPAVAKAAMESGVATRPIQDFDQYKQRLSQYVFRSSLVMSPLFEKAKRDKKKIIFGEGEDPRVLRAIQQVIDEGLADPIVVGRRSVLMNRIKRLNLRIEPDRDFLVIDPEHDKRYNQYWEEYHRLMARKGVSPDFAKMVLRTNTSVIATLFVHFGEADAALCGPLGRYDHHLTSVLDVIGLKPGVEVAAAMSVMAMDKGVFFMCDPYVNFDPTADQIAEMAIMAAEQVKRFGITPRIALLSHSNFGSSESPSSQKMRAAREKIQLVAPELQVEGEMHADAALNAIIRDKTFPGAGLNGQANILMMPNIDASNIAFNMVKVLGDGQPIGPVLLGPAKPVHILTPSITTRGIMNMVAIAAVDAQSDSIVFELEAPFRVPRAVGM